MAAKRPCRRPALPHDVVKSRAGLVPESDYILIEKCQQNRNLAFIARLLNKYTTIFHYEAEENSLENLIAYLRLYCDSKGYEFDKIIATSHEMYFDGLDLKQTYN
ncbi:MAG TPA: hypothetical protein VG322_16945 [Candidatus Acidoferrales bacterium]|jgi:hypothetical protein|nr:hypothetical protein [Candidatus Acidoferrales bacterium]